MSFLLGAFGKMAAHREKRTIQAKMMRIQSKKKICTKQIAAMDKQLNQMEKLMTNQVKMTALAAKQNVMTEFQAKFGGTASNADATQMQQYQTAVSNAEMVYQNAITQGEQDIANKIDYLRETQYEPLKDEEDLLQSEYDSLQTQLQQASDDYEACQKMEQDGAKEMKPNYVAGGN